jgi:hypothetical protein
LETLDQHNKLFDSFIGREVDRSKLIENYVDACKLSNNVKWIYPRNNYESDYGYPKNAITLVITSSLNSFATKNPSYNKSIDIINKCNARYIQLVELFDARVELFDVQAENLLDIDGFYIFEKIIKELTDISAKVAYVVNDYRSNTVLFHEYVFKHIESTKIGIEYILNLEEVVVSCSARITLLKRELPENTTTSDLSTSRRYVNECGRYINAYTNTIIKAIERTKSLKNDMIDMDKINKYYIALEKKISVYAKNCEEKFKQMINGLFSLESLLGRQIDNIIAIATVRVPTEVVTIGVDTNKVVRNIDIEVIEVAIDEFDYVHDYQIV